MTSKTKTENMQSIKPTALQKASLFFIAIAMLALYSCNSSSGNGGGYQQPVPSLPVITINSMAATTYQEFSASLEGTKDIEIRPQVDGYLDKIYVDEGAYVKKGDRKSVV